MSIEEKAKNAIEIMKTAQCQDDVEVAEELMSEIGIGNLEGELFDMWYEYKGDAQKYVIEDKCELTGKEININKLIKEVEIEEFKENLNFVKKLFHKCDNHKKLIPKEDNQPNKYYCKICGDQF